MNLYGFANGDPVNFTDPFGLFPCCSDNSKAEVQRELDLAKYGAAHPGVAVAAAAVMLGVTTGGLLAGAAPALVAAPAAAAAGGAGTSLTGRIVDALENSGAEMAPRVNSVLGQVGNKLTTYMSTNAETGTVTIQGGAGNNLRQVILNTDGSSVVRAFDAGKNVWNTVKEIKAP
jgi:hypothetical protein